MNNFFTITAPKLQKIQSSRTEEKFLHDFLQKYQSELLELHNINHPLHQILTPHTLLPVRSDSRIKHRKTVEQLAYYFKREFEYDFCSYESSDADPNLIAFIFLDRAYAIGACHFRWTKFKAPNPSVWSLDWAWIHPYRRRNNLLTKAWPIFQKRFGQFSITTPHSPAMQNFLKKQNWKTPLIEFPAYYDD